jgi:hypothetical protein
MIKIKYFMIIFFVFFTFCMETNLACSPSAGCCCNSTIPNQKKCYTSGQCCKMGASDEYWDPVGCYNFNAWVQPKRIMLTLGTKTPIILYVENTGGYTDTYDVNYRITSGNPSLINVELTGVTPTGSVASSEIKKLYPRMTVLSAINSWEVTFNITSRVDPSIYKNTTLTIIEGDNPLSLPEFGIFGLMEIFILIVTIYLIKRTR